MDYCEKNKNKTEADIYLWVISRFTPNMKLELAWNTNVKRHMWRNVSALVFCLIWLQVIVTTPMEMLKIQLQDAGRIGKRKFKKKKRESYGLMFRIEKQWSHVVKLVMTTYNTRHNESFPLL